MDPTLNPTKDSTGDKAESPLEATADLTSDPPSSPQNPTEGEFANNAQSETSVNSYQHDDHVKNNLDDSNPKLTIPGAVAGTGNTFGTKQAKNEHAGGRLIHASVTSSPPTTGISQVESPSTETTTTIGTSQGQGSILDEKKKGLQLLPPVFVPPPSVVELPTENDIGSSAITQRDEPSIALSSLRPSVPQPDDAMEGDAMEGGMMVAAEVVDDEERTKMASEIAELQAKLKVHEEKDAIQVVPIAEVVNSGDGNDESPSSSPSRKWVLLGVLIVGAVVGAVIALISALLSPKISPSPFTFPPTMSSIPSMQPSPHPTVQPSSSPTISRRTLLLQDLLGANATSAFDTVEEWSANLIANPSTPQAQAIDWLLGEDECIWMSETLPSAEVLQRYAFVVLYFATSGPDWITGGSYLLNASASVCEWNGELILEADDDSVSLQAFWQGIDCDTDGLAFFLGLPSTNVMGSLPSEIALLRSLTEIYLDHNSLSGSLPTEIGLLSKLSYLWLEFNFFSGSLPPLRDLSQLESLWLDENMFSGVLPTDIPASLRSLRFTYNHISGELPSEWGGTLTNLVEFYGGNNWLGGNIPSEWGNMTQLKHFGIEYNGLFTGPIPSELAGMTSLTALRLLANSLTGTLPPELGNLPELAQLVASNNPYLGGSIPAEWGSLTRLSWLSLRINSHSGSIPSSIGLMSSLASLNIEANYFSGALPSQIGALSSISHLEMLGNQFSGTLPSEIGSLSKLESLTIYDNPALTGTVPTEFGNLSNLEYFSLHNTAITGSLDSIFCNSVGNDDPPWLTADCLGDSAEIECSCCGYCCAGDVCEYV